VLKYLELFLKAKADGNKITGTRRDANKKGAAVLHCFFYQKLSGEHESIWKSYETWS
jgi:hypothetical protein